jgi:hypothetical protein
MNGIPKAALFIGPIETQPVNTVMAGWNIMA